MMFAIVVSSNRHVPIQLVGLRFFVLQSRRSVSGPFWVTDKRFKLVRG